MRFAQVSMHLLVYVHIYIETHMLLCLLQCDTPSIRSQILLELTKEKIVTASWVV